MRLPIVGSKVSHFLKLHIRKGLKFPAQMTSRLFQDYLEQEKNFQENNDPRKFGLITIWTVQSMC